MRRAGYPTLPAALSALSVLALGACVLAVDGAPDTPTALDPLAGDDAVSVNARRALATCGKGNVAAVSVRGYACMGADQEEIDALMGRDDEEE